MVNIYFSEFDSCMFSFVLAKKNCTSINENDLLSLQFTRGTNVILWKEKVISFLAPTLFSVSDTLEHFSPPKNCIQSNFIGAVFFLPRTQIRNIVFCRNEGHEKKEGKKINYRRKKIEFCKGPSGRVGYMIDWTQKCTFFIGLLFFIFCI